MFNDYLKELRKARGMTQQDLANESGVSLPSIRKYETGAILPRNENIEKLAKALKVSSIEIYEIVSQSIKTDEVIPNLTYPNALLDFLIARLKSYDKEWELWNDGLFGTKEDLIDEIYRLLNSYFTEIDIKHEKRNASE